ncbi:MAG: SRPBCC family protein [Nocardioidaceae bacterium]|nr:SRPBCC family protein [Nocardioidaceae bacterium]
MQAEVRVGIDVDAPPEAVWRWAVDWTRQRRWMPLTDVRLVSGPPLAVGTRVVARTGVGPLGFDDPMTVTAVDAPRTYEVLHTGRRVEGVGVFAVQPRQTSAGERARFEWWERVVVPGGPFARVLWLAGEPLTRLAFGWALRRFARAVEADPERDEV